MLYLLSYLGVSEKTESMAPEVGVEPTTSSLNRRALWPLSYPGVRGGWPGLSARYFGRGGRSPVATYAVRVGTSGGARPPTHMDIRSPAWRREYLTWRRWL